MWGATLGAIGLMWGRGGNTRGYRVDVGGGGATIGAIGLMWGRGATLGAIGLMWGATLGAIRVDVGGNTRGYRVV